MDIALLSMALSQAKLSQSVGIGVLKMAKDNATQQGQDLIKTMQTMHPNLGHQLDIKI